MSQSEGAMSGHEWSPDRAGQRQVSQSQPERRLSVTRAKRDERESTVSQERGAAGAESSTCSHVCSARLSKFVNQISRTKN